MDRLEAMSAFVRVVETGSFTQAARRQGQTRSAVSKAVMELERVLGVRLLDRTTRQVSATEAGRAYFERCRAIIDDVEDAELQVSSLHDEPRGLLRVNAPMSFGTMHLAGAVADFMCQYRALRIELALSDQFVDPLAQGVDVTIRIGDLADSSLIGRRLAPAQRVLVAAPAYLADAGAPAHPQELTGHRCLAYGQTGGAGAATARWLLSNVRGESASVSMQPLMFTNNGEALRAAALQGLGVAEIPTFICGPDIAAGRLQLALPAWRPHALAIHALYAPNRFLAAKTRVFIDFLVARFGAEPAWDRF